MHAKTATNENASIKNAVRAKRIHDCFSFSSWVLEALKYEITETIEATNASSTKKCPTCPGSKCSFSKVMMQS